MDVVVLSVSHNNMYAEGWGWAEKEIMKLLMLEKLLISRLRSNLFVEKIDESRTSTTCRSEM